MINKKNTFSNQYRQIKTLYIKLKMEQKLLKTAIDFF